MRTALIFSLAFLFACSAAPEPPPQPLPIATASAAPAPPPLVIDPDPEGAKRIQADINYLASPELEGRGTGTEGAIKARDYIAKRFADLGLQPVGDQHTYLQQFKARVGAKAWPPGVANLPPNIKGDIGIGTYPADMAVTADGSASTSTVGDAVFAGYGITAEAVSWDDYKGIDVKNKVVFVLGGVPDKHELRDFGSVRYKLRTAREHGATAVIVVQEKLPPPPSDASSMGIPGVVMTPKAAQPYFKLMKLSDKAVADAKPYAPKKKIEIAVQTSVEEVKADAWNVLAMLPAPSKEYVVLGAHYDHLGHGGTSASRAPDSHDVHPGADDNASGTALLLEVARTLSKLPDKPKRNVIFASFGAEELGLIGSRFFIDNPPVPEVDRIEAMINADMVGRLRDNKLIVDGVGTSKEWPELVKRAATGLGFDLSFGSEGFGASDHASFTAAKVPVAFFFTGVHEDYHRPSDTADKINAEGEERVATMAARLALEVAAEPARMAFVEAAPDPHHGGMGGGFRVSLGTMPDYAYQGPGLKLTGVRSDSPAARAGIAGGDVITKVGPHAIGNIHDYMFALGDLEPGREVTVEVDRGGKKVVLKVIPAPGR